MPSICSLNNILTGLLSIICAKLIQVLLCKTFSSIARRREEKRKIRGPKVGETAVWTQVWVPVNPHWGKQLLDLSIVLCLHSINNMHLLPLKHKIPLIKTFRLRIPICRYSLNSIENLWQQEVLILTFELRKWSGR